MAVRKKMVNILSRGSRLINIRDVIRESVMAIFSNPTLAKALVLKGGGALQIMEEKDERLSTDVDFSTPGKISNEEHFFALMKRELESRFQPMGFDLMDFNYKKRPKKQGKDLEWWGGWCCEFKLSRKENSGLTVEKRRRAACIPEGSNSSVVQIEISEFEFCDSKRIKEISGIKIAGYSRPALVVEKLRAICQQHPDYPIAKTVKNRARDFVDIYFLLQGLDEKVVKECQKILSPIFSAKRVPEKLIEKIWDDDGFVEIQRRGFSQVKDTIKGKVYDFDVYLEFVRSFAKRLILYQMG